MRRFKKFLTEASDAEDRLPRSQWKADPKALENVIAGITAAGTAVKDYATEVGSAIATDPLQFAKEYSKSLFTDPETYHSGFAAAGFIPVVGDVADVADAALYAGQGESNMARLSLASALPFIGIAGNVGRSARALEREGMLASKAAAKVGEEAKAATTAKQIEPWQLSIPRTTSEKEAKEQLVDLRKKVNDQLKADTEKFGTKASSTILTSPDVPTFDDLYRRIYGKDWEKVAKERAEALRLLDTDPRLAVAKRSSSGVPYGDYERLLKEPKRAPTYLHIDFDPAVRERETFGMWEAHPFGFPDAGDVTIFPRLIGAEAAAGTHVSLRNVLKHEYGHALGDIDWTSLPSDTQFIMQGSKSIGRNPYSLARSIAAEKDAASLVKNPENLSVAEKLAKGAKGTNSGDLRNMRSYLTPREFVGQATDIQSALRDAGFPIVGPSNIFDKEYGIEAFKALRNKLKLSEPTRELTPLLLDPQGRALIAPVARKAKGSKISDKINDMRLA